MPDQPTILASDLEGVLVPEIWIAVAEKTGIERLRLTTRDIPDYDRLMAGRIAILREHKLTLADIQAVIATVDPLPGALEFLDWARDQMQVIILSDTFYEFAAPLMLKLGQPTLFCNTITADAGNNIAGYRLRQVDGKRKAVTALQSLDFRVIAMGDSYNDTTMLSAADTGILFRPPANIIAEFPQFPVLYEYDRLREHLMSIIQMNATSSPTEQR
ncbi:MAG: bifunctional phosphoserine phosphatase/homoserine phosphotransferase ThrH [Roseiflexaceae bacterium]